MRVEPFQFKSPETKGVISDVPLDLSDDEIKQSLVGQHVCFVKRLPYRSGKDVGPSRSVLVCFNSTILPAVVNIGYLRFRPRPFVPPPRRCFNCCRYGHQAKQCRSAIRCTKCGGRHKYEECLTNNPKCVNCGGMHSAGYGGCPRYREESAINSLMVKKRSTIGLLEKCSKARSNLPTSHHIQNSLRYHECSNPAITEKPQSPAQRCYRNPIERSGQIEQANQ